MPVAESNNQSGAMSDETAAPVNKFNNMLADEGTTTREEQLLEDALTQTGDYGFSAEKRVTLEQDNTLSNQVMHYLGRERRQQLDEQIETLYDRVARELNDNPKEVMFALENLKNAQSIVIEDMRQYEDALFWVAQVKQMLVQKQNMRRWSYSWGLVVFFYGLGWLIAFIAGFFMDVSQLGIDEIGGWYAALAGGIGGSVFILYNLSWQVSIKQEFDRQHIMRYLVQPVLGFGLGAVIFFISSVASLIFVSGDAGSNATHPFIGGSRLVIAQILFGFIAGFGQQFVYDLIEFIVQSLSPNISTGQNSDNAAPLKEHEQLEAAGDVAAG